MCGFLLSQKESEILHLAYVPQRIQVTLFITKNYMPEVYCSKWGERQYSLMDKNYLEIHGICWAEDKVLWEAKKMSTEEFEAKEMQALNTINQ